MDLKNINDNILSNAWKERYAKQPPEIKEKLDILSNSLAKDYQLQVIKRKRIYPETGDIFRLCPKDGITLYGVVMNNHINNINGDDLVLILIFGINKKAEDIQEIIDRGVKNEDLLIPPQIVGKEYWTRGYFYNIDHIDAAGKLKGYGFYDIFERKFFDEYGKEIFEKPNLIEHYAVSTVCGIAYKVNKELIILGII